MAPNSLRRHQTAVLLDDEPDIIRSTTCPLCHTTATPAQIALGADGDWRCARCGQQWDGARLAAVAAYAGWTADHDRVEGPGREDSEHAPLYRDSPPTQGK